MLRRRGMSLKSIAKELSVSSGSVHRWCAGITLSEKQKAHLEANVLSSRLRNVAAISLRREADRKAAFASGFTEVGTLTKRDLLVLGVGLYWGEGDKDLSTLGLSNMDPDLHEAFLQWLESFGVDRAGVRATLHLPTRFVASKEIKWWCSKLNLNSSQFSKTVTKVSPTSRGKTKRLEYHGVLHLRHSDVLLMSRVRGMLSAIKLPSSSG